MLRKVLFSDNIYNRKKVRTVKRYIAIALCCILSLVFCSCRVAYVGSETRLTTTAPSTAKPETKYEPQEFAPNLCTTEDWLRYDTTDNNAKITLGLPSDWSAVKDDIYENGRVRAKILPIVHLQGEQTVLETYLTGYTGKKPNEVCRRTVFLENYTARLVETKENDENYGKYCYTYYIPINEYVVRVAFYSDNKAEDEETTEMYEHICNSVYINEVMISQTETEPPTE